MSNLTTASTESERNESASPRVDVFALTRALVFTKEAYRTLRAKVTPKRRPAPLDTDAILAATAEQALLTGARVVSATNETHPIRPADALTPWDMIDEEDSPAGITFTMFQQRRRQAQPRQAA